MPPPADLVEWDVPTMVRLLTLIRLEWKLQWRTARFRSTVLAYVLLSQTPVIFFLVVARQNGFDLLASNTLLGQLYGFYPSTTVLMTLSISGNRSSRTAWRQLWCPLASARLGNGPLVLGRWLAQLTLLVPVSALPLLTTLGLAVAQGYTVYEGAWWLGTWALRILPLVVVVSAAWLGWVLIFGGELQAFMAGGVLALALRSVVRQVLFPLGYTLDGFGPLLDLSGPPTWLMTQRFYWFAEQFRQYHPGFAATEAPYDAQLAWQWLLPRAALALGISLCVLAVGSCFVGRTQRDLRPFAVRESHPLRTYLKLLNGYRHHLAPDAGIGRATWVLLVLGALGLGLGLVYQGSSQVHYRQQAQSQFDALIDAPPPMALGIRPLTWQLSGGMQTDGRLDLQGEAVLRNETGAAQSHLGFVLDPHLALASFEAPGFRLRPERSHDRLTVTVEPPLEVDQEIRLAFRVAGRPQIVDFGLSSNAVSFVGGYRRLMQARFPRHMVDLSRTQVWPRISARRVVLEPGSLGPVPRYTPWDLTPPRVYDSAADEALLREETHPDAELRIDLTAPAGWQLVDTCGQASAPQTTAVRLISACRGPVTQLAVGGGELEMLRSTGFASAVAFLPAHRRRAEEVLKSLESIFPLTAKAWPGIAGLERLIAIEEPPLFSVDPQSGVSIGPRARQTRPYMRLEGSLLRIPESEFVSDLDISVEKLIGQILTSKLLIRRRIVPGQEWLVNDALQAILMHRMGLIPGGATMSGPPWLQSILLTPLLDEERRDSATVSVRLPAVMVDVQHRLGNAATVKAVETFLERNTEPGTLEELFAIFEETSGVPLDRLYADFFRGNGLPQLQLEAVEAEHGAAGWTVRGQVRNTGTGQVICPVLVQAEQGEQKVSVTVDSDAATPFETSSPGRPLAVLLDPQHTCFRLLSGKSSELERVHLNTEAR